MFGIFSAALAALTLAATSVALPSANSLGSGGVMDKISISDVATMMSELGMTSSTVAHPGGGKALMVTTEGGATFAFIFLGCDDQANSAGCANTVVTAAFSGAGVSLEAINRFNGVAVVTVAVKVPENNLLIFGRNIIVRSGHARELFKGTIFLFLRDIQNFAESSPASANAISMGAGDEEPRPLVFPTAGAKDYSLETAMAIANTKDVTFALPGPAPY